MSITYCSTCHEITAPPGLIELAPGYPSINSVTQQLERKDFCSVLSNTDHTCTYMLCKPHMCVYIDVSRVTQGLLHDIHQHTCAATVTFNLRLSHLPPNKSSSVFQLWVHIYFHLIIIQIN